MKTSGVIFLTLASVSLTVCNKSKHDSVASEPGISAPSRVKIGGVLKLKNSKHMNKEEVEMKIAKAFAYVAAEEYEDYPDDDSDGDMVLMTKYFLLSVVLYNDGANDVSCDTKVRDFRLKQLVPGNHMAVELSGVRKVELEFGKKVNVGMGLGICTRYPEVRAEGILQGNDFGCSRAIGLSESVQLTEVSKNRIAGTISVENHTVETEYVRGKFVAEVCPITTIAEYRKRQ